MNAQEQQAAKVLVGTAVFLAVFFVLHTLAVPALAVAYVKPELSAGTFDLWTIAVSVLAPVVAAYVSVSSKVGGLLIVLLAKLLAKLEPTTATTSATSLTVEEADKRYAKLSATSKVVSDHEKRLQAAETAIAAWSDEEPA